MCGIVAYVGRKIAQPLLIEGLKRLEYRGYDSAGIAVIDQAGGLHVRRAVGRISVLENTLHNGNSLPEAHLGMAHTRWATPAPVVADRVSVPSEIGRASCRERV